MKEQKRSAGIATVCLAAALVSSSISLRAHADDGKLQSNALMLVGTNLSGAEFGSPDGVFGRAYIYPSRADLDFVARAGMNVVRLPVRWERLQPELYGALDSPELERLKQFVEQAGKRGITVIINVHNYARYRGNLIGSELVPTRAFEDLWAKLAAQFLDNKTVAFGLMNEPHGIDSTEWVKSANAAIAEIRRTGAKNLILAPGVAWTGAHSWTSDLYGTPNSIAMLDLSDPLGRVVIEVHQYLDKNSSGTSSDCVNETIGRDRLNKFTLWAREHGKKAFLGEFGAADNKVCQAAISNMLNYVTSNSDVWMGWSWWSAGPWWGKYPFSIQPNSDGSFKPQMSWLTPFISRPANR